MSPRFWSNVIALAPLSGGLLIFLVWQMVAAVRADRRRTDEQLESIRRAKAIADARQRVRCRRGAS